MRTAVVGGMIATFPVGGVAWDYAQYALGLERLGFDVYYLEDNGTFSYDPIAREYGPDPSYGLKFLERSLAGLSPSLAERWHVRDAGGQTHGIPLDELREIMAASDLFLNVSGGCLLRAEYMTARRKVLIDTDPGWNHFDRFPRSDDNARRGLGTSFREHDYFFTYAEQLGNPGCALPSLGIEWVPTRMPIVIDSWAPQPPGRCWTTVLSWDNYGGPIEYEGRSYGSKEAEFAAIETLPDRVTVALEVAAGGVGAPIQRWQESGWQVIDSTSISRTADDYRNYIQTSRGEFSVAKNVYVDTRSGWFSCRSACYLASARPVVLQETGFSGVLPTGEGLLSFSDLDGAIAAIGRVENDYETHSAAARSLAAQYFAHDQVLGPLLERIGVA